MISLDYTVSERLESMFDLNVESDFRAILVCFTIAQKLAEKLCEYRP